MKNLHSEDPWERGAEFPPEPLPAEPKLKEGEMQPEEVVDIYQRQIEPYKNRARYGMRGFVSNIVHAFVVGRVNRPSEMRDEAQQEIEFRQKVAFKYSQRNLPELQAMAAHEANEANKNVGQPPFESAIEVKEKP